MFLDKLSRIIVKLFCGCVPVNGASNTFLTVRFLSQQSSAVPDSQARAGCLALHFPERYMVMSLLRVHIYYTTQRGSPQVLIHVTKFKLSIQYHQIDSDIIHLVLLTRKALKQIPTSRMVGAPIEHHHLWTAVIRPSGTLPWTILHFSSDQHPRQS